MALVLGVGVGLFVVAFIWILCLTLCLVLSRAEGAASYVSFLMIVLGAIITIILVFIPREPADGTVISEEVQIFDYSVIYRTFLVAGCGVFLLIGLVLYVVFHMMEPIYAKPIKKLRS